MRCEVLELTPIGGGVEMGRRGRVSVCLRAVKATVSELSEK